MAYLSWRYLAGIAVLIQGPAVGIQQAAAQTQIAAPTATTQIVDFRVADGTWEEEERTYTTHDTEGMEIEVTEVLPPELEVFDVTTRPVEEQLGTGTALDGIMGTFKGLSQNADGVLRGHNTVAPNTQEDFVVETFAGTTSIGQWARYGGQADVTRDNGRVGSLQWGFDLSPLDTYLANEGLQLDNLEVNLRARWRGLSGSGNLQNRTYDLLLSYTNPSEDITLADISTEVGEEAGTYPGSETNWHVLYKPGRLGMEGDLIGDDPRTTGAAVGDYNIDNKVDLADYTVWRDSLGGDTLQNRDPANGGVVGIDDYNSWKAHFGEMGGTGGVEPNTHKIVAQCIRCDVDAFTPNDHITTIDLLSLYEQGVRQFNLVATTSAFATVSAFNIDGPGHGGLTPNDVNDPLSFGSGVYISTSPAAFAAVSAVPEPGTAVLLLLAMGGLYAARSRK